MSSGQRTYFRTIFRVGALWAEASHSERRDILRAFIANVTPLPTHKGWAQHVRVTMQPYVAHMPPTTDRHLNAYRFKRE